uniref:Uncharacterized protein n=1 Tax=Serinus canaria TaxID=9135 RepID=A0A8C9NM42_SERCA
QCFQCSPADCLSHARHELLGFHLWKTLEQVITETLKPILTSGEVSLILSTSPRTVKAKIKAGHRKIIVNLLYKGRSPYLTTKVNEEKNIYHC